MNDDYPLVSWTVAGRYVQFLDRWFSQLGTSIYREFSIAMLDYRRMMGYAKTYHPFGGAVAVIFVANHGYKLQDLRYNS